MRDVDLAIGLPVFNGASLLAQAIDSLLAQSYAHFILIISDNASTDDTRIICERAAAHDNRVIYIRQPENIGWVNNFRFTLNQAHTPYFMWAAHDDRWHKDFVAKNLSLLNAEPHAVASVSRVAFEQDGVTHRISDCTFPLRGSVQENLRIFWRAPSDCSRFYAIHRTEILRRCFPDLPPYHGFDYLVVALTLGFGHYLEVPEILLWRTLPETDKYVKMVDRDNPGLLFRLFPILPISVYAVRFGGRRLSPAAFTMLVRMNIIKHREYVRLQYPALNYIERAIYYLTGLALLRFVVRAIRNMVFGRADTSQQLQ
jgi:glycosyltransferase involved in cell wall biosynthesis